MVNAENVGCSADKFNLVSGFGKRRLTSDRFYGDGYGAIIAVVGRGGGRLSSAGSHHCLSFARFGCTLPLSHASIIGAAERPDLPLSVGLTKHFRCLCGNGRIRSCCRAL